MNENAMAYFFNAGIQSKNILISKRKPTTTQKQIISFYWQT